MHATHLAHSRLINQQITRPTHRTASELVRWMGAVQAQDYAMVKWALGSRLPHLTEAEITTALDSGELIRTHVLRPTWHVVAAEDVYWMLKLTAPRIKALVKGRDKVLDLTEPLFAASNAVFEKVLAGGHHLTRQELMSELEKAGIRTDSARAAQIMIRAELDGIVANGAVRGKQQTYALLEERVPNRRPLSKEEALAKLAQRYFTSHGPATLNDFVWWSGLSVAEARQGLESIRAKLLSEQINSQTYWFSSDFAVPDQGNDGLYALPAFDEYVISYRDRSAVLALEHQQLAISGNGIFNPILVRDGKVIGTWKRTMQKDKVLIEVIFFQIPDEATLDGLEKAFEPLSRFLNQKIVIK
ncbi:winged helix DNA-binding domain-containing protein [Spirosoma koreense]